MTTKTEILAPKIEELLNLAAAQIITIEKIKDTAPHHTLERERGQYAGLFDALRVLTGIRSTLELRNLIAGRAKHLKEIS